MFEIETEKVKLKATGNPIFLLDLLVTTNAYVFRPSRLRHLTARGRHHRNFEENKRLFAGQKNMYFLPCTFCTPHLEITSFVTALNLRYESSTMICFSFEKTTKIV